MEGHRGDTFCIGRMQRPDRAAKLFAGWKETMIWSCLQGVMGNVYGDHPEHPGCAAAVLGDFCFLAGEPNRDLVLYRPKESEKDFMIMVPQNRRWSRMIQECLGESAREVTRYGLKKEPDVFDKDLLRKMAAELPDGYTLRRIDRELYERCITEEWSRDLVGQYRDFEEYERLGLGFAVIKDDELISGASSYSSYQGGIEIQIDTQTGHRRKGLARVCGAALILECLKRGLYPSWDAQNKESLALAEQLGYHPGRPYTAYEVCDESA